MAWAAALLVLFAGPAAAQRVAPAPGLEVEVSPGYGRQGVSRRGDWSPVRVVLRRGEGLAPVAGWLALEDWPDEEHALRAPRILDAQPVELAPGSNKRLLLVCRLDPDSAGLRVTLRDLNGRLLFREELPYLPLSLGATVYGVAESASSLPRVDGVTPLFASVVTRGDPPAWPLEEEDLRTPTLRLSPELLVRGGALRGLDAILVSDPAALDAEHGAALREFAEDGGRLLVSAGTRGVEMPAALAECLPLAVDRRRSVEGGVAAIDSRQDPGRALAITVGAVREGARVLRTHAGIPLAATWRRGKGQVAFLAFPIESFAGSADALEPLVREALPLPGGALDDLSTSDLDPLEDHTGRAVRNEVAEAGGTSWIAWTLLAFLLVVGPLDFVFWRRHRSSAWTWRTLVATSLTFSALALVFGHGGDSDVVHVRGVAVLDPLDPTTAGEQPLLLEGLCALGSDRRVATTFDLAPEVRVSHGRMATDFFNPLQPERDDGNGFWVAGNRIAVRLALANPLVLRLSGRVTGSSPATARWVEPGVVELCLLGDGDRDVYVVSPLQAQPWLQRRMAPGTYRIEVETGLREGSDGSSGGFQPHYWPPSWRPTVQEGLLLATFSSRGGSDDPTLKLTGPPVAGRVDATRDLLPGGVCLLIAGGAPPLGLSRGGQPAPAEGHVIYRLLLEPPAQ